MANSPGGMAQWLGGLAGLGQQQNTLNTAMNTATGAQIQQQQQQMQQYAQALGGWSGTVTAGSSVPLQYQPYVTTTAPSQWTMGVGTAQDPVDDLKKELDSKLKDITDVVEDLSLTMAKLLVKVDKMNEILLSLVKVDIPEDEIRKALSQEVAGTEVV